MALFQEIDCNSSFFLFDKGNLFRIICYKMIRHGLWETSVQILIFLSSLKLAIDTYFLDYDETTEI